MRAFSEAVADGEAMAAQELRDGHP